MQGCLFNKMKNSYIAKIFRDIAAILQIKGDSVYKVRAYERAAQNIEGLSQNVEEISDQGKLEEIPGVGKELALKIREILQTGHLQKYEDLQKEVPQGVLDILSIPGIGPKTVKLLYEKLHVKSIDDVEREVKAHTVQELPGIRVKTEKNILYGIELIRKRSKRLLLHDAQSTAGEIIEYLKPLKIIKRIDVAGSLRRAKETVGDIDIIAASGKPDKVMDRFVRYPQTKQVLTHGTTKSSIVTFDNTKVDLRVVDPECFGSALLYFTGSKEHNIRIRKRALMKNLKVNEYGVFDAQDKRIASKTEQDVYNVLNLAYIPPQLREDTGEIQAAEHGRLPDLIQRSDIKGVLHVHTNASDGKHSLEEIVYIARRQGLSYVAITDHSQSLEVAAGLSEERLLRQIEEIHALNKRLRKFMVLTGTEVDIKLDGSLDYSDEILKNLDIVIASIHVGFRQSREVITERIISAMNNKYVHIIAHPTGRLIGEREPYDINMDEVFKAALRTGTCMEINSHPRRLDLNDVHIRKARELGVKMVINTDMHVMSQFETLSLGIMTAQRGWLEKKHVLNTLSVKELLKQIKK